MSIRSWVARYAMDTGKFWSQLIDFKYSTKKPNIPTCSSVGP
jgi:hypothetical protein